MLREDFDLGTPVALHREHRRIDPFAFHEAFVVELSWIAEVAGETNSALKPHSVAEPKRAWMKRGQANNPSRGMRGSPLLGCDIDRNIQTHLVGESFGLADQISVDDQHRAFSNIPHGEGVKRGRHHLVRRLRHRDRNRNRRQGNPCARGAKQEKAPCADAQTDGDPKRSLEPEIAERVTKHYGERD